MPTSRREAFELSWDEADAGQWHGLLTDAGRSSLEQSWAYGAALEKMSARRIRRGILSDGHNPIAVVQVFERQVRPLGTLVQITRGPLWLRDDIGPDQRSAAMRRISECWRIARRELLVWMPELPDTPENHALMRGLGARRMVTGYSTAWLDLRQDEDSLRAAIRGNWRNQLTAAENAGLRVETSTGGGPHLDWLLSHYESFRRRARFAGPGSELIRNIAEATPRRESMLLLRAFSGSRPVAGILVFGHGAAATYCVGWTDAEGRRLNAHNLLLWRAALALAEAGTAWLDLGGLFASTAPGVARFKLGLGGEVETLAGTYI